MNGRDIFHCFKHVRNSTEGGGTEVAKPTQNIDKRKCKTSTMTAGRSSTSLTRAFCETSTRWEYKSSLDRKQSKRKVKARKSSMLIISSALPKENGRRNTDLISPSEPSGVCPDEHQFSGENPFMTQKTKVIFPIDTNRYQHFQEILLGGPERPSTPVTALKYDLSQAITSEGLEVFTTRRISLGRLIRKALSLDGENCTPGSGAVNRLMERLTCNSIDSRVNLPLQDEDCITSSSRNYTLSHGEGIGHASTPVTEFMENKTGSQEWIIDCSLADLTTIKEDVDMLRRKGWWQDNQSTPPKVSHSKAKSSSYIGAIGMSFDILGVSGQSHEDGNQLTKPYRIDSVVLDHSDARTSFSSPNHFPFPSIGSDLDSSLKPHRQRMQVFRKYVSDVMPSDNMKRSQEEEYFIACSRRKGNQDNLTNQVLEYEVQPDQLSTEHETSFQSEDDNLQLGFTLSDIQGYSLTGSSSE